MVAGTVDVWAARQASGRQCGWGLAGFPSACLGQTGVEDAPMSQELTHLAHSAPIRLQLFYDDEHGNIRRVSTLGVCSILVGSW